MDKARLYLPDGKPRFIRCYNTRRNPAIDHITVVYTRANTWGGKAYTGTVFYVGMSDRPFHPHGFCQHGESPRRQFHAGGSRIPFHSLPTDCQKQVIADYASLWGMWPDGKAYES
jgi:hypothetical protein